MNKMIDCIKNILPSKEGLLKKSLIKFKDCKLQSIIIWEVFWIKKIRREPLLLKSTTTGTWKNLDRLKETGKGTRHAACCSTLLFCCQNFQV